MKDLSNTRVNTFVSLNTGSRTHVQAKTARSLACMVLGLVLAFSAVQKSLAVESLSTAELAEHCAYYEQDPDGVDATFCIHYIQGFIDGAIATDETVVKNVVAEYKKEETFTERALRTRMPSRGPSGMEATYYAEFCLGPEILLKEVVEHVIADLMSREVVEETLLARDAVYAALRRDYPCENPTSE